MKDGMRLVAMVLVLCLAGCSGRSPGGFVRGQLQPCPASPNCVCSEMPDRNVDPLAVNGTMDTVWPKLRRVIVELGGEIVMDKDGYLHATFRSRVFGFVDDLECRMDGQNIHVRSAARLGWSDFGVNRARVEKVRSMMMEDARQ